MKKTFSVFAAVLVMLFSFGSAFGQVSAEESDSISIVVLGDSIARGYGLKNVEAERFSTILENELEKDFSTVTVSNFASDGIMGSELLDYLKNSPPTELEKCDYVVISIGGNNILRSLSKLNGISDLASEIDPKVFVDYFRFLMSKDEKQKEALDYARQTLDMFFKAANDAFAGDSFNEMIAKASNELDNEIPQIVSCIRESNPNARIIIQTVYNPFKGMHISLKAIEESLDLESFGEIAVEPLNEVIESHAVEYGYTVAPVHEGFDASSEQLTNAGFDLLNKVFGVDPHPNSKGHRLIAEIYLKIIKEEHNA